MTYLQSIVLAIVQGLTEFLPISSSGHLVIFQNYFDLKPPIFFDVMVHVGTLGAVLVYFRKKIAKIATGLIRRKKQSWRLAGVIVLGTLPAVIVGLILQPRLGKIFDSITLVGVSLMVTALFLLSTKFHKIKNISEVKHGLCHPPRRWKNEGDVINLTWQRSLFIGFFQALAILPGVSRSGSTIAAGLFKKLNQEEAFYFSFLLAIPAIIGALVLQLVDISSHWQLFVEKGILTQSIVGMAISSLVGYWALVGLKKVLTKGKLWVFGIYCLGLGFGLLVFKSF
ncbi:undecaprenyl-diphosphate phosphatase [Patescibacteria group bacterium]